MHSRYGLVTFFALVVTLIGCSAAQSQTSFIGNTRSVALVLGQSAYRNTQPLPDPVHDSTAIASTLRDLGFDVTLVNDGSRRDMDAAVDDFLQKARGADVAFLYYAGHGVQRAGVNYLVPVDAALSADVVFDRDFISLTDLLDRLEDAVPASGAKIVVIDACRNNPWDGIAAAQTGTRARGLAPLSRLSKSKEGGAAGQAVATGANAGYFRIIAYSTAAEQTAEDGDGEHSPYTSSLLRFLPQQGLEIGEIFRQAAADVQRDTKGRQRPEYLVQTSRPLYLRNVYATECDRLAIEGQNFLGLPGVPFDDVDPKLAIPACEDALKGLPDSARLHNNLARAYEKAERLGDALTHYAIAAKAGYAPAINAYGIARLSGCGLPRRDVAGGLRLIAEARTLGNLSAKAALTTHDMLGFVDPAGIGKLQSALGDRGLYRGRPDGRDKVGVTAALKTFQERNGLARKGLTLETVHALGLYDIVPNRFHCH